MSTVRLAFGGGQAAMQKGLEPMRERDESERPALLVSFVYLAAFQKHRAHYGFRDWVLDSGAFSAHNAGKEIRLADYITACKKLRAEDEKLTEIYSLDVIGDWKASLKNTETMWRAGVEAIPCYHAGEPWDVLKGLARDYPKIALGGVARMPRAKKLEWAGQCFARVWPCKMHGFGFGAEKHILALPWHSVDSTSWELGPCCFGRWNTYGQMDVRGSAQNLRVEVEFYLNLEKRARRKWRRQMEQLDALGAPDARLAVGSPATNKRVLSALAKEL